MNERVPLSYREYGALKYLFGLVSAFEVQSKELERRAHTIPYGWRDMRMLASVSARLLAKFARTIPEKKLRMIQQELRSTRVTIDVKNTVLPDNKEKFTYVPEETLNRLIKQAFDHECLFCEKAGADAKKCPLRADIEMCYMFDLPADGTACPFAGITRLEEVTDESGEICG